MITQEEYNQYLAQGYSEKDIQEALQTANQEISLQEKYNQLVASSPVVSNPVQTSAFYHNPTDNLVKWQLELNDILERAEHILREDIVMIDNGKMSWVPHPHPEKRIFYDYGVQEIMRILAMYLNRNTILSDYEPDEINYKVYDIGKEVNDLIYMKYESFGLDNAEKRKNYPMLVREIIDIVHSAYKRALYGQERESLRTAREIHQQEQINSNPNINVNTGEMRKERGMLNPARWVLGKFK